METGFSPRYINRQLRRIRGAFFETELDAPVDELVGQNIAVADLFYLKDLDGMGAWPPPDPPHAFVVDSLS